MAKQQSAKLLYHSSNLCAVSRRIIAYSMERWQSGLLQLPAKQSRRNPYTGSNPVRSALYAILLL